MITPYDVHDMPTSITSYLQEMLYDLVTDALRFLKDALRFLKDALRFFIRYFAFMEIDLAFALNYLEYE